jgi:hypothetical protein
MSARRHALADIAPSPVAGEGVAAAAGGVLVHGPFFCPEAVGKKRQVSATAGTQSELALAFGVHRAPRQAAEAVLRQIESEAHALEVSIAAGHHKLAYVAACIGKSEGYVSRLRSGERPIPERLVGPLCAATGSTLLAQYRARQEAIEATHRDQVNRLAALLRSAA